VDIVYFWIKISLYKIYNMAGYSYDQNDFVGISNADDIRLSVFKKWIVNNISTGLLSLDRTIMSQEAFTITIVFQDDLTSQESDALNNKITNYSADELENETIFLIKDIKSRGTNGGGIDDNTWTTRDLNSITGSQEIITLVNNTFIMQTGSYVVQAHVPGCKIGTHQARLRNITDGTYYYGTNADSTGDVQSSSFITASVVINEEKTFDIQHICEKKRNGIGLGKASGLSESEIYTNVIIHRVS
jgi:hypothetical protein